MRPDKRKNRHHDSQKKAAMAKEKAKSAANATQPESPQRDPTSK